MGIEPYHWHAKALAFGKKGGVRIKSSKIASIIAVGLECSISL